MFSVSKEVTHFAFHAKSKFFSFIYYCYFYPVDKAKVIYAPTEIYLPYGRPATLDCHFRSNPPLTNLRWEKDGFLFDPYNVQVTFQHFHYFRK